MFHQFPVALSRSRRGLQCGVDRNWHDELNQIPAKNAGMLKVAKSILQEEGMVSPSAQRESDDREDRNGRVLGPKSG